jgi:hypothetical protein
MNIIDAILELESLGYRFTLEGANIVYSATGNKPAASVVHPLLETIKGNKDEAVGYLIDREEAIDLVSHLFAQAEKAEKIGDFDRSVRLLEAAGLARSKTYARNEFDRYRCPECPYLGQGSLYELNDYLVLCDKPCPVSS